MHVCESQAAFPTPLQLCNLGDGISLSSRLMDSLRKQAVQFVLQDPGATSDNTLARSQANRQGEGSTYNETTVHFF